jgi:hypothetical protein
MPIFLQKFRTDYKPHVKLNLAEEENFVAGVNTISPLVRTRVDG